MRIDRYQPWRRGTLTYLLVGAFTLIAPIAACGLMNNASQNSSYSANPAAAPTRAPIIVYHTAQAGEGYFDFMQHPELGFSPSSDLSLLVDCVERMNPDPGLYTPSRNPVDGKTYTLHDKASCEAMLNSP